MISFLLQVVSAGELGSIQLVTGLGGMKTMLTGLLTWCPVRLPLHMASLGFLTARWSQGSLAADVAAGFARS